MKTIIIILLTVLTFGCSKDKNSVPIDDNSLPEQQETFNLTTKTNTVMPLQYVIVHTEITLNQNSYNGTIGGQEIELIKSSENELIFIVPQVNAGTQLLELTIGNKNGKLNLKVSENIILNVNEIINTELVDPVNILNQNINDLLSNNTFSEEITNNLISANQMIDEYLIKFNTLSEEEKLEVAKFYNANPLFTNDFFNLSEKIILQDNSGYDCFKVNSKRVVLTTVTVLGFVAALPHLNAAGPFGSITALVGFVAGVYAAQSIISASHQLLLHECFLPFEHALNDSYGNSDNFEINNDFFQNFTITSKDRHIIASDIANSNAVVSYTIEKINVVTGKWQKLKNGINTLISNSSSWFSSWFSSSSNYQLITYEFEDIPQNSEELEFDGESEFISIEDFPTDIDVEVNITSDNSIDLKLTTNESTLPRTVNGKIIYSDGDFVTENSLTVIIKEPEFDFTGFWQISFYTANVDLGVDYLHQQNRFTTDASGYAPESEVRYPTNPPPNNGWQPSGEVNISYSNGLILFTIFSVVVNDFDDIIFYSDNWETNYTVDDYYWKVKLEKL